MNQNKTLSDFFETARKLEKEKEIALTKLTNKPSVRTKQYASMILNEQLILINNALKETETLLNDSRNTKQKIIEIIKSIERELKKEKMLLAADLISLISSNKTQITQKAILELKENVHKLQHIDLQKYGLAGVFLTIQLLKERPKIVTPLYSAPSEFKIRISEIFVPSNVLQALLTTINKENMNLADQQKLSIYINKDYLDSIQTKNEFENRILALDLTEQEIKKYLTLAKTKGVILLNETLIKNKELLKSVLKHERFSRFLDLMHPEGQKHLRNVAKTLMNKLYILEEDLLKEPLNFYESKHFTKDIMNFLEKNHSEAHKILQNLLNETEK
ncbi:hypothetical protein COV13_01375 [Candidatus Woesearchaeota archaeon CG10_big_fil_rev_8_21_14_0_10_32_9]|nr:MAG: hypothetical protein COV13_01375 [Candidatus Woesearchaeota archaeon CG10_big_fil_rev_8_21_14_0_10_32_9]